MADLLASIRQAPDLDSLYALMPPVACQGRCTASCGPIGLAAAEVQRFRERRIDLPQAKPHPKFGAMTCGHLSGKTGQCRIYGDRPMICRLWGAVPEMACPFGCKAPLSSVEGRAFLDRARALRAGAEYFSLPEAQRVLGSGSAVWRAGS